MLLYLGTDSAPNTPTRRSSSFGSERRAAQRRPAAAPVLVLGERPFTRLRAGDAAFFYFEIYIKASGGGLHPSGSVGVGLADAAATADAGAGAAAASEAGRFIHYHSGGRRYASFPRPARTAGRPCGPSFGVGDTIGCGWRPSGEVFFTGAPLPPLGAHAAASPRT